MSAIPASARALCSARVFENVSARKHPSARTAEEAVNDILYTLASPSESESTKHTLSVLVDNEAGVLSKVSGLLSARGFNIDSLAVNATDVSDLSRMTIVLDCPETQLEQAKRQLEDLVDVWAVVDLSSVACLRRELVVLKLDLLPPEQRAMHTASLNVVTEYDLEHEEVEGGEGDSEDGAERAQRRGELFTEYDLSMSRHFHREAISTICETFGAKVADVGSEHISVELSAGPRRVDAFIQALRPFGVVEAARSGTLAMARGKVTPLHLDDGMDDEEDDGEDLVLPPG